MKPVHQNIPSLSRCTTHTLESLSKEESEYHEYKTIWRAYLILDELLPTVNDVIEPIRIPGRNISRLEPLVISNGILGRR